MRYGWTLEKQEWDCLLQVVNGTSWSKTRLGQLYRNRVPDSPGVYVICVKLPNFNQRLFSTLYNVIYVGKAEEMTLHERFLIHCRQAERGVKAAKRCFGDSLEYWFTEVSRDRVAELEKWLIDCFGPPANGKRGSIPGKIGDPRPA